jgi:hypothetical protein
MLYLFKRRKHLCSSSISESTFRCIYSVRSPERQASVSFHSWLPELGHWGRREAIASKMEDKGWSDIESGCCSAIAFNITELLTFNCSSHPVQNTCLKMHVYRILCNVAYTLQQHVQEYYSGFGLFISPIIPIFHIFSAISDMLTIPSVWKCKAYFFLIIIGFISYLNAN